MQLFVNGQLNVQTFDQDIRAGTHDLGDILGAAARTQSVKVESTHFLIAISKTPGGVTQKHLGRMGLTLDQWESGLSECAARSAGLPPTHLTETSLHATAKSMLETAQDYCDRFAISRISESVLLLSGLQAATPAVRELCTQADIDLEKWCQDIKSLLEPVVVVDLFTPDGALDTGKLSPSATKVMRLLRTEAESLGFDTADLRHLLLGLLESEGGATHYSLHNQSLTPRKLQETLVLGLRNRSKKTGPTLILDRAHMQPLLQRVITVAGELAGRDHADRITEAHLLRAFLTIDSAARRILEDEKVNLVQLGDTAERFEGGEEEDAESSAMADVNTVKERLLLRLVGQEDAVTHILPYIQRMRFGFTTPGRPVGVFLFCGQSGSGKTEMAKELARAVYGSEENLIFLEMGQFNSPESMNIFVGAPPGYVGYGEGKLTNGLRDKPRAVILFDEIEKAHAKVLDALLRFVDEGKIDDPAGPVRDGAECLVILTSNVGAHELSQLWREIANSPNRRTIIRKRLRQEFQKNKFRVEFLNRLDEVILFRTLEQEHYTEIARRFLARELERLHKERGISVEPDPGVAAAIGDYCGAIDEGARAVRRLMQSVVITPVIDFVVRTGCVPPVSLAVAAVRETEDPECEPTGVVSLQTGKSTGHATRS